MAYELHSDIITDIVNETLLPPVATGATGVTGQRGILGASGSTGATGATGVAGFNGIPGQPGYTGFTGDNGPPGKLRSVNIPIPVDRVSSRPFPGGITLPPEI